MYITIFGRSILEVMPTKVPGMEFSAKLAYAGYTIHFGMQSILSRPDSSEADLLLHPTQNGRKYDLLPSRILCNKFPTAFVDDFVHWYDHDSGSIEFCPLKNPWPPSSGNWRLTKADFAWRLAKNGLVLIGVLSNAARVLSDILSALEEPLHIHASLNETSDSLDIDLPRLQLGFHLQLGASVIQSRQFRGMSIDGVQEIGTLVGLRNRIVLKQDEGSEDRLVLIPEGHITYQGTINHTVVDINNDTAIKVHAYHVDNRLGRMIDNGNLQSKLFLSYLHALTSHCLPDRLTRRTGTEQALSILNSAAVKSFDCLTNENLVILERIAKLTAAREYYPANERVMQTVTWDSHLSFLSQHGIFYTSVKSIFEQSDEGKLFYPNSYIEPPRLDFVIQHLLERDLVRSSTFRVFGYGAEHHTTEHDVDYSPRDRGQNSERAIRTFVTASLIFQGRAVLHAKPLPQLKDSLWSHFMGCRTIQGPGQLENMLLNFDSSWLEKPSELLSASWCRVHRSLGRSSRLHNRFHIMMWISTIAFAEYANMQVTFTMAAFYNMPDVASISPPPVARFDLFKGATVAIAELEDVIRAMRRSFKDSPEARIPKESWESKDQAQRRRRQRFQDNQESSIQRIASALESQWPCKIPQIPAEGNTYLDMGRVMEDVRPRFKIWFENHCFHKYLGRIVDALRGKTVDPIPTPHYIFSVPGSSRQERKRYVSIDDIFANPAPLILPDTTTSLNASVVIEPIEVRASSRLETLLARLKLKVSKKHETDYIKDLSDSVLSLQGCAKKSLLNREDCDIVQLLNRNLADCSQRVRDLYSSMTELVGGERQTSYASAATVHQWPRVSPALFLEQLIHMRWKTLSDGWKSWIIAYGLALTELQRVGRLIGLSNSQIELKNELLNVGHRNWDPVEFPESLLLEIESGIMIREVQEEIACQMRNPPSNENAVMQLNMGEGKSSVIVPMAAVALADGTRLVRVIVAKPQSKQMFQMLVSKLGGLLGRRIYHMPFSRALRLEISQADLIGKIYRDCMANRGIVLLQPEHILSFELMCLECLAVGHESIGCSLLKTQHFFDTNSRDIVDESDENFSVRFELVYTMGMQRPIELSPERWTIIQKALDLVARFAPQVKHHLPHSIEVDDQWPGRFPRTRILRPDAREQIMELMADHICNNGFSGFPIARQPEKVRQAVFKYVTKWHLTVEEIAEVEIENVKCFRTDSTRNPLLLIRGLIAGGVLSFAFGSKRWRVNYGLDPNRLLKTKLAVPFRAKDNPKARSEFSHPDVVIVLTSLSYYYGGLDDDDLFIAFSHLVKSDQAHMDYGEWVRTAPDLLDTFRLLDGINVKDRFQCVEQVFPALRYSKGAIDYFLSRIVFPREMKEFPHKISTSGWDIGQVKTHPTTGFSGTNDSRHVLPLSIQHLNLPEQMHTNALVIEYILQNENSVELLSQADRNTQSDAMLLLTLVTKMDPAVRVILDVGAQILELTNLKVAEEWLAISAINEQTKAVVFFNDNDELSVIDRTGRIELLQTSTFAKQLDTCLVFLDEAHTRGTDLRLPQHYRAAVTLGANLTKDGLVQGKALRLLMVPSTDVTTACMRMRKLGKGQSVVFCVPEEIKTKILQCTSKQRDDKIEIIDVLIWAISETCADLQRSMPLWAAQGRRFEDHKLLWEAARSECGYKFSKEQAEMFLEEEAQTLDYRYRPHAALETLEFSGWDVKNKNIGRIIERCLKFESLNFTSATLQEEQERELSPEIEQERQIERPTPAESERHNIHDDVKDLVKTGGLVTHSKAFLPAFEALHSSSAAVHFDTSQFPHDLLVTADFARTVKISGKGYFSDAYQRSVQWILTGTGAEHSNVVKHMIIISPFEAQELLPLIKERQKVTLHIYAPRLNLEFRPLDALDLFVTGKLFDPHNVPRDLIIS